MIEDILNKKAEVVITKPEQSAVVQATQAMTPEMLAAIAMFMNATSTTTAKLEVKLSMTKDAPHKPRT